MFSAIAAFRVCNEARSYWQKGDSPLTFLELPPKVQDYFPVEVRAAQAIKAMGQSIALKRQRLASLSAEIAPLQQLVRACEEYARTNSNFINMIGY